ncbi:thiolase domain-containing protein [Bradyrhizobium sp. AS23.2]|uniref:thiolase domain-containing protein n=1 Tax=Bradyrhizobium sp. AS23.2 TaxID=1680155 RepID=UPI00093BEFEF|nr:thiolase domain-containing protein [Bradyrhizobium sp. AS23.2]OKO84555.1 acetyl-CoA acetyltransferase [Bradyrhizobium sp. AS23.2]
MADDAYIVGIFEHPTRLATDLSVPQLHAEAAFGALADAGLSMSDVDAYYCGGDATGLGPLPMATYLNMKLRHFDSTDVGGSTYLAHVSHARDAIRSGRCDVALITCGGRPRASKAAVVPVSSPDMAEPDAQFEVPYNTNVVAFYAMAAARHMHEFGTTSEQLAWIKVAASQHAQHNPHAMLPKPVTVDDVLSSPVVASPLHRLDCCVVSDGGAAVVMARSEIARSLKRPLVKVAGAAEAIFHFGAGEPHIITTATSVSGPRAFAEARRTPADIKYTSVYDSFTITALLQIEDLGFCKKGQGGPFVADGNLISGRGALPFNTDGGGLCNNHMANRGGITKIIEAVRQVRGEAHPAVQVKNCDVVLANGIGAIVGTRHAAATLILERQ